MNAILTKTDRQLFTKLAAVMAKHPGGSERFAIALKHDHFPLSAGEVIHETSDARKRISTRRVQRLNDLPVAAYPTEWAIAVENGVVVATPRAWCCDAPST